MSHKKKIFGNDLVAIRKNKFTLKLNKRAYDGIYILNLSNVSMYEFHYDYIKNKYDNSRLLSFDTDRLLYHIKAEDVYKNFSKDREIFYFRN